MQTHTREISRQQPEDDQEEEKTNSNCKRSSSVCNISSFLPYDLIHLKH